jgi:hypothetical protein
MKDGNSIGGERVLECARSVVGSCPGGREAAPELFAAPSGEGLVFAEAESSILSIPAWAGARGAILFREPLPSARSSASLPALLVVWIEPRPQPVPDFPSQLGLHLPGGRYAILTFDSEKRLAVGSETACGPPVLCGPPFDGAAVVVLVRPLAGPLNKVLVSEILRKPGPLPDTFSVTSRTRVSR